MSALCPSCASELPDPLPAEARCPACSRLLETTANSQSVHSLGAAQAPNPTVDVRTSDVLAPPQGPGEMGRIGRYRVLGVLGQGGMGMVFHAEDVDLRRPAAIKVMLPALAAHPASRERFLREARAAAAIEHEHIIAIYHVGVDRDVPFVAMPLLKGETLEAHLKKHAPLPADDVVRIGREIAEGLAAAHARGLIHRDIKPANIWLEGDRRKVKIPDFGLARIDDESGHLTQPGAVLGTPAYMAPEQARGEPVDARADLFGLGSILYHATTGRRPFTGANPLAVLSNVTSVTPKPPCEVNPKMPAALSDLVMTLLSKNRDDRPASARAVALALDGLGQPDTPNRAPSRRRRALAALVVLAVLVSLLGWAAIHFRDSGPGPDPGPNPGPAIPPPTAAADDADRRAAEYALTVGGTVLIDDREPKIDALPKGPFRLTQVHFGENQQINDSSLKVFENCRRLTHVNLSHTRITDAGLAHFAGCEKLVFLAIASTAITDDGIEPFLRCKDLRELYFQKTRISPQMADRLQRALPGCKIVP